VLDQRHEHAGPFPVGVQDRASVAEKADEPASDAGVGWMGAADAFESTVERFGPRRDTRRGPLAGSGRPVTEKEPFE